MFLIEQFCIHKRSTRSCVYVLHVAAQLRVKTLDGEAITLRVLPTDTVASVKGKIQAFEGVGPKSAISQL